MRKISFLLLIVFSISGCKKSDEKILEDDIAEIVEYLNDNNLEAESTLSGLHYIVDQEGNGVFPDLSSDVRVNYRGFLPDGTVFDQSPSEGIEFPLLAVIVGWQEGIPFFSVGGSGSLYIPSELAYGRDGAGSDIGPNQVLFFDIELLEVN